MPPTLIVSCARRRLIGPGGFDAPCAIGKGGWTSAAQKQESDGATPLGVYPLRELWWRADRLPAAPRTGLPSRIIQPEDGWCDAPADPNYNRPVRHPYKASAERLWRHDAAYDLIVPLGYNDDPATPGKGSAIFLHVARPAADGPGFRPTLGCIAIDRDALIELAARLGPGDLIDIRAD